MKPWFSITNKADNNVDVLLYGEIGGGWSGDGVEAKAFAESFAAIPQGTKISLRIHSPGGSVFDGLAIHNTILERTMDVVAHVDGLAASAASFIAMAASKVVMPKTSRMMIHDAQGFAVGDSKIMQGMADLLERESDNIADIYARKTGKSREEIRDMMRATTWMDGAKALALGFADEVTDTKPVENNFDLSIFKTPMSNDITARVEQLKANTKANTSNELAQRVEKLEANLAKLLDVVERVDARATKNSLAIEGLTVGTERAPWTAPQPDLNTRQSAKTTSEATGYARVVAALKR